MDARATNNHVNILHAMVENAVDGIVVIDEHGIVNLMNPAGERLFGYRIEEVLGHSITMLMPEPHRSMHDEYMRRYVQTGRRKIIGIGREVEGLRKDGSRFAMYLSVAEIRTGEKRLFVGIVHDLTDLKRVEEALFAEKERAQVTLHSIADGVITTDVTGAIEYMNPLAEKLTGWELRQAQGQPLRRAFRLIDERTGKRLQDQVLHCLKDGECAHLPSSAVLLSRDGQKYAIQNSAAPIRGQDGAVLGAVLVFSDVTAARQMEQMVTHQATHDALTGLVNRNEFEQRLRRVLASARVEKSEHVLCYVDLDQFKVINDTCGHLAGDELLRQLAGVLQAGVRKRDTLARLGGDEFGLLLEHCSIKQARRVVNGFRKALEQFVFLWQGTGFHVGASIGMVPVTSLTESAEDAMRAVDTACYAAKEAGRDRIYVLKPNDQELEKRYAEMHSVVNINRALREDRFRLTFQPIIPIGSAQDRGAHYELLLRMEDENGSLVRPNVFLPAAERYHLATRIDRWVVETAFEWLSKHDRHVKELYLCSINLSGQSLSDAEFLTFLRQQLRETGVPAEKICFEVTETAAISNLGKAVHFIESLRKLGCRFALDDFGRGLSSFAYLKTLPVDFLKIDGMFVTDVTDNPLDTAILRSIQEIGRVTGKQTIAEHVEDAEIVKKLFEIGLDYVQGYWFGRPQPIAKMAARHREVYSIGPGTQSA